MRIAEAGEFLGLSAVLSDEPHVVAAETRERCQLDFVRRDDFLSFLRARGEACLRIARSLSDDYSTIYEHARQLLLSQWAAEKLARLLLRWCAESGGETEEGIRVRLRLTQEDTAKMICASRETVTRLLSGFKRQEIIRVNGSALLIRDKRALETIAKV